MATANHGRTLRHLGVAIALTALTPLLAVDCGGSEDGVSPCDSVYAGECGLDCLGDSACAAGLYCGPGGKCTADCAPDGGECGLGVACSENGRCGQDPDDFTLGTEDNPESCADINVTFEQLIPTVVLLIDQSGSMDEDFGGGTRWNVLRNTLLDPQTGLIKILEDDVRFGLALYTSENGNEGGTCPMQTEVQTSLGNYEAIKSKYDAASLGEDTPTGESIAAVAQKLSAVTEPGPKIIVLATDGEPDTCAQPDPQNGQAQSVSAAVGAYDQGIQTYVISVGADVGLGHLQDIANAGVGNTGNAPDAPFYQALDQAALIGAFDDIIDGVRSCIFTLNGEVVGDPGDGTVTLDGEVLGFGDDDGWKLNHESEIELVGAACAAIQDGEHNLDVVFPCGSVDVPAAK